MALPERLVLPLMVCVSIAAPGCGEAPQQRTPNGTGAHGGDSSGTSGSSGTATSGGGTSGAAGTGGSAGQAGGTAGAGGSDGGASAGTSGASSGGSSAGSGTGGSDAGGSSGGSSGASGGPTFELLWRDDFNSLDAGRWGTASHTFDESLAQFTPANVVVEDGFLKLRLTPAPEGSAKPYLSGEARTHAEFTYGRFETRARFARGSGLVSSLFTFYDHLPMNWNEIDVEFLGRYGDRIQYNTIFWDAAQARQTHEYIDSLEFDPSGDFHVYAIEWVPGEVRFLVDGQLRHSETEGISTYMTLPQKVMMNLWPANIESWVGPVDTTAIPAESQYDWVSVYTLLP